MSPSPRSPDVKGGLGEGNGGGVRGLEKLEEKYRKSIFTVYLLTKKLGGTHVRQAGGRYSTYNQVFACIIK